MARASVAAQRRRARSSSTDSRLVYFVLMVWTVTFRMQTILPIEGENWISYSGETPKRIDNDGRRGLWPHSTDRRFRGREAVPVAKPHDIAARQVVVEAGRLGGLLLDPLVERARDLSVHRTI